MLILILSVLLAVSLAVNYVILKKALRVNEAYISGIESVEESIYEIEKLLNVTNKILATPLASNDPFVVKIHKELQNVHSSVAATSEKLSLHWNINGDDDGKA